MDSHQNLKTFYFLHLISMFFASSQVKKYSEPFLSTYSAQLVLMYKMYSACKF